MANPLAHRTTWLRSDLMNDRGYTITQPLGLATESIGEGEDAVKVPKYGTLTYTTTYTDTGCRIDVSFAPTDAGARLH